MTHVIVIFLLCLSIWYTMQPGEIFGRLGKWFEKNLPKKIHPPVFACNVCLTPWYGSVLYWLIYAKGALDWIITVIAAMGLQVVLNKLSPKKVKPILEINPGYTDAETSARIKHKVEKEFPEYNPLVTSPGVIVKLHSACGL